MIFFLLGLLWGSFATLFILIHWPNVVLNANGLAMVCR